MRIYIIPTRYGLLYSLLLGVFLWAGVIYSNNSVLIVAFILASLLMAVMIETHSFMKALSIERVEVSDGFAGSTTVLQVALTNKSKNLALGIEITPRLDHSLRFHLSPQEHRLCQVAIPVPSRGRHRIPKIGIGTSAPLGLFWAWTVLRKPIEYLGYPQPIGRAELPDQTWIDQSGKKMSQNQGEDFVGHRHWQSGESQKQLDWKAFARRGVFLVKEFKGGGEPSWILEFQHKQGTKKSTVEAELSQLSLWIQKLENERRSYGLKINSTEFEKGQGPVHARTCLRELALYETK